MTRLLDAGAEALAESGYHGTRVDDVVRFAGVSHGTFYLYFSNKEDLFRAMATRCAEDMEALASELGEVGPDQAGLDELRRWIGEYFSLYRLHGPVIRAWAENQIDDRALQKLGARSFGHITGTFADRLESASPRPVTSVDLRAAALLAMLERFAYLAVRRNLGWDDAAMLTTIAVLAHRGWFAET